MDDADKIREALTYISADLHREEWARIGMSIKAALGAAGWSLFDEWSQRGQTYKAESAKATWRSISATGGIGPGTLFKVAQDCGYDGHPIVYDQAKEAARKAARAAEERAEAERKARGQARAARISAEHLKRAAPGEHAYLSRKGFREARGLCAPFSMEQWRACGFRNDDGPVHSRILLVPMRAVDTDELVNLQLIQTNGTKTFLPGGRARGAVFRLGRGDETFIVEGYATALSVMAALGLLYRQASVLIVFSAGNIPYVAERTKGARFVVADNDASGAGAAFSSKCGLPWWQPPRAEGVKTVDANDYHLSAGLPALADELRRLRRQ